MGLITGAVGVDDDAQAPSASFSVERCVLQGCEASRVEEGDLGQVQDAGFVSRLVDAVDEGRAQLGCGVRADLAGHRPSTSGYEVRRTEQSVLALAGPGPPAKPQ